MNEDNVQVITIRSTGGSVELLRNDLEEALGSDSHVRLHVESPDIKDRSVLDPTLLVAVVASAGAGLPKLIEGLFGLLTPKEKIILKGKEGRSIEVPADTPDERLRELIRIAKALDVEEITLSPIDVGGSNASRSVRTAANEAPATSEWYVSYAWGDDRTPEGRAREEIVDHLCAAAAVQGHVILRDKNVLNLGDRISTFMKRIGRGDRIFVILSDKYLRSPYCMFELSEIWRTSQQEGQTFLDRVRIYALPDAKILRPEDWVDWSIYWKGEHDKLESRARQHGIVVLGEQGHRRLTQMRNLYSQISDILGTVADIVQPRTFEGLERYGFDDSPDEVGSYQPLQKS